MTLPLSIFESCDVLQPPEISSFDSLLLQARTGYYDYIEATARSQWQLTMHIEHDLREIANRAEGRLPSTAITPIGDPIQNDLASRINFAFAKEDGNRPKTPQNRPQSSRMSTPLVLYQQQKRYTTDNPPQTELKYPATDGPFAGWLGELRAAKAKAKVLGALFSLKVTDMPVTE